MNRSQRIQQVIWTLLRLVEEPRDAVATAKDLLKESNFKPTEITSILRAAGAFARDETGYFLRYDSGGEIQRIRIPKPTHFLTMPVPIEPRMRIAYNVFSGLLLKYLYQRHSAVPIEVSDGFARLWAPNQLPNTNRIWESFRHSSIAETAISDGLPASLDALLSNKPRPIHIGALPLTETLVQSVVWKTVKQVIPKKLSVFQKQTGKVPDFIWRNVVRDSAPNESLDQVVELCIKGARSILDSGDSLVAKLLHKETEDGILKEKWISQLWNSIKSNRNTETLEVEETIWQVWDDRLKQVPLSEVKEEQERLKELKEKGKNFDKCLKQDVLQLQKFIVKCCESSPHLRD